MITWSEQYNNHRAVIAGFICLFVTWGKYGGLTGYKVSVSGVNSISLKHIFDDLDEAKKAAISLGVRTMTKVLEELQKE